MKGFSKYTDCINCQHECILKISQNNFTSELLNSNNSKEITYNKGETIIKQGAFISHSIYIKKGLLKVVIEAENGKEVILDLIPSKRHIGLPFLYMDDFYPFSLVAVKETEMCLIRRETVLNIIEQDEKLNHGTLKHCSNNYLKLYNKLVIMGTRNNHGKLAHTLLYLSDEKLKEENVFHHITRRDIAELSFISIESVNKILNEMKNDLIIEITEKGIKILKPDLVIRLSKIG